VDPAILDERLQPAETMDLLSHVPADDAAEVPLAAAGRGTAATFTRNSALSVVRLLVSTAVALILPAYLTHTLPVKTYSAWVLILQMSAYVGYLDFGVQTGIAKYVAEYEARGDSAGAGMRASAGLAIMCVTSMLGALLTLFLAWRVPQLFREMPDAMHRDVRISLVLVGISLSFGLLCSTFSAVFLGLQRYAVPMILALVNRILFTAAVMSAVFFHQSLAVMGALVAMVNVATGVLQFGAWRRLAGTVRLSLRGLDYPVLRKMVAYCSALAVWTLAMLFVSGLDVTIVGRYDFGQTAFYAVATMPTNFMISLMGAALAPLLPTASAMSVDRESKEMGDLLSRATRYSTILLLLCGLPLLVGGPWLLRMWVGPGYAAQTSVYLRVLVLANLVRNLCLPYAGMLLATGRQRVAIAGATAEALVNLGTSVYLVQRIGAIGVAYGTLLGAFVSVGMHFALSMHYTSSTFSVSRMRLFLGGVVRPLIIAIPSLLLVRLWWSRSPPTMLLEIWPVWAVSTLLLAWYGTLDVEERGRVTGTVEAQVKRLTRYN